MNEREFDKVIGLAPRHENRVAWFGALLQRESRARVEIVEGSAIELYLTSADYVSQDIDVVSRRDRVTPVLRRWGFQQVKGRSQRTYWFKRDLGLVDIVGEGDRSGLRPHRIQTPYGPVLVSAVEPLIARRLVRSHREKSPEFYRQAVRLAKRSKLDWQYLDAIAKFEGVEPLLGKLKRAVDERAGSSAG